MSFWDDPTSLIPRIGSSKKIISLSRTKNKGDGKQALIDSLLVTTNQETIEEDLPEVLRVY